MARSKSEIIYARAALERYKKWLRENPEICRRIAEEVRLQNVCEKNSKRERIERGKAKGGTRAKKLPRRSPSRSQVAVKVDKGGRA